MRSFASKAAATIIVKCAEEGAYGIENGEVVHMFAFSVRPRNTVGAGDSFNAGMIAAQSVGLTLRKSMEFACAVAALKISRDELPSAEDVEDFLTEHPQVIEPAEL